MDIQLVDSMFAPNDLRLHNKNIEVCLYLNHVVDHHQNGILLVRDLSKNLGGNPAADWGDRISRIVLLDLAADWVGLGLLFLTAIAVLELESVEERESLMSRCFSSTAAYAWRRVGRGFMRRICPRVALLVTVKSTNALPRACCDWLAIGIMDSSTLAIGLRKEDELKIRGFTTGHQLTACQTASYICFSTKWTSSNIFY